MACISMQSLMMSPPKPSSPRSSHVRMRRDMVAGSSSGSSAGNSTWLVMMAGMPASTARRKGSNSHFSSSSLLFSTRGNPRCESTEVSPCPGKCLPQAITPPSSVPRMKPSARPAAFSGSSPKLRTPMTGFAGLEFTSSTGARLKSMPTLRSSLAVIRPAR